ncbi:esterase/lipase family protein [Modestobacter sp. VKM Ac-2978]|uniref:esterase/lipase family protein n=1 Tax=Modestobacter sp. VKM Ac-2978 TaxID=3004132 RepID=UPI0022AA90AA|nr:alpha/beta fold hydrolase [Modestobacter sp. VKM Ac-2978]MCZ2848422.1 alpha/beta fold hydrolase [Modestobacter sp. VKM Ac-2978]
MHEPVLPSAPAWHAPRAGARSDVPAAPTLPRRTGLRRLVSPGALTGSLTELAWVGAHTLLYPLGTRTERLRPDGSYRPGAQPAAVRALFAADPLAARIPVVLVHGLIDNRSVFTVMRRSLRRRGFAQVCTWNYSPLLRDVESAAEALGQHIEEVCRATGHDRVHVVGHSLGGLVARYLVQRLGGDARVESLVTLGTPHGGSRWAHVLPTRLVRQLRPGSDLFQELAAPAPQCRTRVTAVYSDLDQMVVPSSAGRCEHPDLRARNVLVPGVGHMSLPIHRGVVDEVAATLAGLRSAEADPPAAAA